MTPKATQPVEEEKALVSTLGSALAASQSLLTQADYDDESREESSVRYMKLRQKDLKGSDGRVVRAAGGFAIGKTAEPEYDDAEELHIVILGFKPGRTYFKNLTDGKPSCKTDDMVSGSAEAIQLNGHRVFGKCPECWYSQWGSGMNGMQACRENRRIFAFDLATEKPVVLTLSASSFKSWKAYADTVDSEARKFKSEDGKVPFIHHLLSTTVKAIYRAEPAGHYVVKFEAPQALPQKIQIQMIEFRKNAIAAGLFKKAVAQQEFEATDFNGDTDYAGTGTPF